MPALEGTATYCPRVCTRFTNKELIETQLGPSRVSDSEGRGGAWESTCPAGSSVVLMVPVHGPHFENHRFILIATVPGKKSGDAQLLKAQCVK